PMYSDSTVVLLVTSGAMSFCHEHATSVEGGWPFHLITETRRRGAERSTASLRDAHGRNRIGTRALRVLRKSVRVPIRFGREGGRRRGPPVDPCPHRVPP